MSVLVLASLNADLVVAVIARPAAGETVTGSDLAVHPGGKGGNQAAAAARAGAAVRVVGAVGDDPYGPLLLEALRATGAGVDDVRVAAGTSSGTALITVTPDGENAIVVSPGANGLLDADDVAAVSLDADDVAVAQLEVPLEAVLALGAACTSSGARLVLNAAPAPGSPLPPGLLAACDPLVVNEIEAVQLLGVGSAEGADAVGAALVAAQSLRRNGCRSVVVTLGGSGAVAVDGSGAWHVAAPRVEQVVDTTGAGDCLVGTLAARLARGAPLVEALRVAVLAASLAVQHAGAQTSYRPIADVDPGALPPAVPLAPRSS